MEQETTQEMITAGRRRPKPKKFTFDLQECEPGKIVRPTLITFEKFRAMNMNSWDEENDDDDDEDGSSYDSDGYDVQDNEEDDDDDDRERVEEEDEHQDGEEDVYESYDIDAASTISSLQGTFDEEDDDDELDDLESHDGDLHDDDIASYSSDSSLESGSNHYREIGCSDELSHATSSSSLLSETSKLSNHCSDFEESDEEESDYEEGEDEENILSEEKEEVDGKLQDMKDDVDEESESEFDDIEYVNNIAMCGSHDDDSSVSEKEFESIMDKVQNEDTFYEPNDTNENAEVDDYTVEETVVDQQSVDDIDSISCQVLKRKQYFDDESRLPSKKRSRTIESTFFFSPSCPPTTVTQEDMSSSVAENECKVLDCHLAEELLGCVTPSESDSCTNPNPVTLLTPPGSPVIVQSLMEA